MSALEGGRVGLRQVVAADYEHLRLIETGPGLGTLYRHRGVTPSPENYAATLWHQVVAQFVGYELVDRKPIGLVACYNADFRNGHAYIAALLFPSFERLSWPLEMAELFIDYLFDAFPFRKLYGQVSATNLAQFDSGLNRLFDVEGRFVAHEFEDGKYVDVITISIFRTRWETRRRSRLADLISARGEASPGGRSA